jgi:hypothetical protein
MDLAIAIQNVAQRVTKRWAKVRRAEERAASARENREYALIRCRRATIKDAVFSVMRQGITNASGNGAYIFPKRNLYYAVRKLIQKHTAQALSKSNFEKIVAEWEAEHGPIEQMYCDARGFFVEPHTGNRVPLGTREVGGYFIPPWRYDKILFVEKKGFHVMLQKARLAERFDLGIMCAEGYSSEAGKLLLARAEQDQQMTILCLHDADPYGYNIARKLRWGTRPGGHIRVVDLGLSVADALALGLEPEGFYCRRALPRGLDLNAVERQYFQDNLRFELNDLASDPQQFIDYVERKLKQHGCARKLVPPRDVVLPKAKQERDDLLKDAAREQLSSLLDLDALVADLVKTFARRVRVKDLPVVLKRWKAKLPAEAWDAAVGRKLAARVERLEDAISKRARVALRRRQDALDDESGAD